MNFPLIRANCGSGLRLTLVESAAMENAEKPAVRWMDISAEQAGQRIDNYLLRILKGVPKSRIYRLLRKGEVRVNKGRIRPEYRLQSGDQVRIPPVRVATSSAIEPGRPWRQRTRLRCHRDAKGAAAEGALPGTGAPPGSCHIRLPDDRQAAQ